MDTQTRVTVRRVTQFWIKVDRGDPDECWPWTGYAEGGYGRFFWNGKMVGAHELALTFATGEERVPELDTCHSRQCVTTLCCNPEHLRFDTRASNVADSASLGRMGRPQKLTAVLVRELRERRSAGASQADLAAQYGISNGLVSEIVRGKRWSLADGPLETERRYVHGK